MYVSTLALNLIPHMETTYEFKLLLASSKYGFQSSYQVPTLLILNFEQ
jgi:hypothetical protein